LLLLTPDGPHSVVISIPMVEKALPMTSQLMLLPG